MFATLLGALPQPPAEAHDVEPRDVDVLIEAAVRAQQEAGLEPITDGRLGRQTFDRLPSPGVAVERWQATAAMTDRAVKQALPGPFALGGVGAADERARELVEVVRALAQAGCPMVEIEETALVRIVGEDERAAFRRAHDSLFEGVSGTHLSLSIVGAAPDQSAWATVLALQYQSLAVDLIDGPDSWNLVTRWAGDRGVVAGVESGRTIDEPKEVLLWAAHYAASTQGRGLARVGLGSAGSWANLTWEAAVRKMRLLAEAARLATLPPSEQLARSLEPKAVSSRRAALGHDR